MPIDQIKDKVVSRVADSLVTRLLRNAGIEDIVEHPKRYKIEVEFEDDGGVTLKVRKKKK